MPLPTYPFQRKRYWLASGANGAGDLTAAGQAPADHPLLGAAVELAGDSGEGLLFTGRLSLSTHPLLADHVIAETVLLPGTAFLELALRAGEQAGAETVEELTLQVPLVLTEAGAVAIQVSVSGPDEDGRREISIHSRAEGEGEWVLNASGALSEQATAVPEPLEAWPPVGAEPLEVDYLYDVLAEHGLEYGPAFQGLTAAWKEGEEIYAEVSLPEEQGHEAERFAIHPALLDSALHGIALAKEGPAGVELPWAWSGVSLVAEGVRELRVRIAPAEGGASLVLADGAGNPVAEVGSLAMRPLSAAQLRLPSRGIEGQLGLEWAEAQLPEQDTEPSEAEVLRCEPDPELPCAGAARKAAEGALEAIQAWLADESKADLRLALLSQGAMATSDEDPPDPAAAAVWGLIRSAQSEHPGRFALIDTDGSEASEAALPAALALGAEEPQLALREGIALAPRLARIGTGGEEEGISPIDPERTVLITGATGGLGPLVTRHIVERHGARRLLLISRSGPQAEGAQRLQAELEALGAQVTIAACDASDPKALAKLIDSIPDEHSLGAVIHCAGALADATVEALAAEQVEHVFAPKAEAAWNLHELTKELDLSAFVLFSSAAGTIGAPGQANYAAANVFLDALAQKRRAEELPATSIAWGPWERTSGMTSGLGEVDLRRMRRGGVEALTEGRGLALFDAALGTERATALALPIDARGLSALASAGVLPPIFSGLVRTSKRRRAAAGSLATKLAGLSQVEAQSLVLDMVRGEVATILGHASAQEIEPDKAFQELGFDSLAAVELRNRLSAVTGLSPPPTLVFDYPTAEAVASKLLVEAGVDTDTGNERRDREVRDLLLKLETTLSSHESGDDVRERASTHLRSLLANLTASGSSDADESAEDLASMSHEEMFELIDEEFGSGE